MCSTKSYDQRHPVYQVMHRWPITPDGEHTWIVPFDNAIRKRSRRPCHVLPTGISMILHHWLDVDSARQSALDRFPLL